MSTSENNPASGYGKPPKERQFKPGQSGNPKGRPKGARGLKQVVRAALDDEVNLVVGGQETRKTKREVVVLKLIQKAASGDVRAIDSILNLDQKFDIAEEAREAFLDPDKLDAEYREVLENYVAEQAAANQASKPTRKSSAKKPAPEKSARRPVKKDQQND
ncbi:MAG: hypothetical protein DHS20C06_10050 [Hyphobacterium sp.]|nr:MAG: hypothetical protein DHS20C06_10050 [Hyphobacterium sp.]